MEIAVGVCRLKFFAVAQREASHRLVAGLQYLALIALIGADRDPLDIMLGSHRVSDLADRNDYLTVFDLDDRHMLFDGGVSSARNDLRHRFAAA